MSFTISERAQSGFTNAASYDTHRPSYPPESVNKLLENLKVANVPGARILDLAAGTGKFTSLLAARPEGYEILAVEPHAEMRQVLEKKNLKGVEVKAGTATSMDVVEDGWADAVVIAQAFHWFANMDALHEIYKKLVPGGILGLIWNVEDYNCEQDYEPATKWEDKLKEITWSLDDSDSRFRHARWHEVFDDQLKSTPMTIQSADPLFSLPLGEDVVKWTNWLSKDAVWDRFHTISHTAVLKGQQLEDVRRKAFEAMTGDDVEQNDKGEIPLHGRTIACWTTAIPGAPLRSGG